MSQHLFNSRETLVSEALSGYILSNNQHVTTLSGHPNVIIRRDWADLKDSVALLSGGGSGHEPAHLGYIGPGMLTACVCGDLFASPSSSSILSAIRLLSSKNSLGILLIVKNYTGDRLHFGVAMQRAQLEGLQVQMVLVDDDVASGDGSVGGRGICGTILIHKLAGAMSEQRIPLDEMKQRIDSILQSKIIRTIGLSLGAISMPGAEATEPANPGLIHIGLGIHGEAAKHHMKLTSSAQMAEILLKDHLFKVKPPNDEICLMVNNLGCLAALELHLFVNDCISYIRRTWETVQIRRLYVGSFMTALSMNGVSLTVLEVHDDSLLQLLDAKSCAPAWPVTYGVDVHLEQKNVEFDDKSHFETPNKESNVNCARFDNPVGISKVFKLICTKLKESRDQLNALDMTCGDGDCGNSISRIADSHLAKFDQLNFNEVHSLLSASAELCEEAGGSLSILLALFLGAAAHTFRHKTSCDVKSWSEAISSGLATVQEYGRAKVGERSIVDPLAAIEEYLKTNEKFNFEGLVEVTNRAVQTTSSMQARVGRASYVDASLVTSPDAGATAIGIIVNAICEAYGDKNE